MKLTLEHLLGHFPQLKGCNACEIGKMTRAPHYQVVKKDEAKEEISDSLHVKDDDDDPNSAPPLVDPKDEEDADGAGDANTGCCENKILAAADITAAGCSPASTPLSLPLLLILPSLPSTPPPPAAVARS